MVLSIGLLDTRKRIAIGGSLVIISVLAILALVSHPPIWVPIGAFEPLADGARTETAYRALVGVLTAVLVVAVAIYSRSQDVKPSDEMRARAAAA